MKIEKIRKQEMVTDKPKSPNPTYCFSVLHTSNITHNSVLSQIFDIARNAYCILSDQYTDNSTCFVVRAGTEQEETESSD